MKTVVLPMILACLMCAVTAQAGVVSVGLDYVGTSYDAGTQTLTLGGSGLLALLTYDDKPQDGLFGTKFRLTSSRISDFTFGGGDFKLTNSDESIVHLSGSVNSIVFDYSAVTKTLSGSGTAEIMVENLEGNLLGPAEIVTISFNLTDVVNFDNNFSGLSKINILVPEPATMTLLGLGGLLLRRKK